MKVTCQLCGTKFDLEGNGYRCPECASVYRQDGVDNGYAHESINAELKGAYDNNFNNTIYDETLDCDYDESEEDDYVLNQEMVEYYQKLREEKSIKDAKAKKVLKGIVITFEIIIIAFFLLMPFLGKGYSDLRLEEQKVTEKPPIVEVFRNEPMVVGNYEVRVTDCYVDDKSRWKLPDNYVVYAVEYETTYTGQEYHGPSLYYLMEVYLETESGPTIAPLESYDASEFMVYEEYKEVSSDVGNYIQYGYGILYFVAKDHEEIYGLCFDAYTGRESDEYYRELDKVYLMKVSELEVE